MSYRLLTFLLWPVFLIYTLRIAFRDKSLHYLKQRLGFGYRKQQKDIWIHCASVGEVNTYLTLHHALQKQYPDRQFIITTNTCTGATTVASKQLKQTEHVFLPIESGFAIHRFLNSYQPQHCLIMETEIWPLLYQKCHNKQIPITLINARLSHRTLNTNAWIKSVYRNSLTHVDKILCKSQQELNNFKLLDAADKQLMVAGNLKFTASETESIPPIDLNGRDYCVAASTHNDEEQQLAQLWNKLDTDCLLVLVPRHPNRSQQIQQQLKALEIDFAIRSQQQPVTKDTKVYLADTLGELKQFYLNAKFVFIGGSLIKRGGQNILEPARLGKATLCGPHMYNFTDEIQLLLEHDACIQANDIQQLGTHIQQLLSSPEQLDQLGENAKTAMQQQTNIITKYLTQIKISTEIKT